MINNMEAVLAEFEESGGITGENAFLVAPVIRKYVSKVSQMPFVNGVSVGYGIRMEIAPDEIEVYTSADLVHSQEDYIKLFNLIGELGMALGDLGIRGLTPFEACDTQMKQHPGHRIIYLKE